MYKKTKPTNLSVRDKIELTFRKIKSQFLRTFFTALSLALAFSFTILFNGIERGITNSYDAYFEALNKANSYAFSFVPENDVVGLDDYIDASTNLLESYQSIFDRELHEIVVGNSVDVAFSLERGGVEKVTNIPSRPDLLSEYKLRLIHVGSVEDYTFDDLFIDDSLYPYNFDELMVTSKFYREYFQLSDDVVSLNSFIRTTMHVPLYEFGIELGIYNVEEYLNVLIELEDGSIVWDDPSIERTEETSKVRFLDINLPQYCYNFDDINEFYQDRCDQIIKDEKFSRYFESIDEYIEYIDGFKEQVNNIDPDYFDILFRSGAIYYVIDENEIDEYIHPLGENYIESLSSFV